MKKDPSLLWQNRSSRDTVVVQQFSSVQLCGHLRDTVVSDHTTTQTQRFDIYPPQRSFLKSIVFSVGIRCFNVDGRAKRINIYTFTIYAASMQQQSINNNGSRVPILGIMIAVLYVVQRSLVSRDALMSCNVIPILSCVFRIPTKACRLA